MAAVNTTAPAGSTPLSPVRMASKPSCPLIFDLLRIACNSFPGVLCGHIVSPLDAYLFSQVNDGNCVALPFAENFGWGGELNLEYVFEKLFCAPGGGGYPKERVVPEQRNKKILDEVKKVTHTDMVTILKSLDGELVKGALSGEKFVEYFFADCKCDKIAAAVKEILA